MFSGLSNDHTLQRTRAALGKGTVYRLGKGGFDPTQPMTQECDCSGFVAWAIGIPRELPPGSDQWLAIDNDWQGGSLVADGLFDRVGDGQAQPGDLTDLNYAESLVRLLGQDQLDQYDV